jgi:hypothetical protein
MGWDDFGRGRSEGWKLGPAITFLAHFHVPATSLLQQRTFSYQSFACALSIESHLPKPVPFWILLHESTCSQSSSIQVPLRRVQRYSGASLAFMQPAIDCVNMPANACLAVLESWRWRIFSNGENLFRSDIRPYGLDPCISTSYCLPPHPPTFTFLVFFGRSPLCKPFEAGLQYLLCLAVPSSFKFCATFLFFRLQRTQRMRTRQRILISPPILRGATLHMFPFRAFMCVTSARSLRATHIQYLIYPPIMRYPHHQICN